MSNTPEKRFEDWIEVECNSCSRYWDSSCDAVDRGVKRPCKSFLATRSIVIPAQINALNRLVKRLMIGHICLWFVIAAIVYLVVSKVG